MLRMTERRLEAANAALQAEVAARIESELEIRRERDMAQRYLDVAGVMILTLNDGGFVTLINNRGCAILGYDGPGRRYWARTGSTVSSPSRTVDAAVSPALRTAAKWRSISRNTRS